MTKKRPVNQEMHPDGFVSLNVKLTVVIVIALLCAMVMFMLFSMVELWIGNRFFSSEDSKTASINERYESLEKYIKEKDIRAEDSKSLKTWAKSRKYTEVLIYSKKEEVFSYNWDADMPEYLGEKERQRPLIHSPKHDLSYKVPCVEKNLEIKAEDFKPDLYNRKMQFKDGLYFVYINVYTENAWYRIVDFLSIFLCVAVFFIIVLRYNRKIINNVIIVSDDVRKVSNGEFDYEMGEVPCDELGILMQSVDNMRNVIITRMEEEKKAVEANAELITSMSHDIRTPLTSLIGYLTIIENGKYSNREELEKYVVSCRDKAFQLKGLSDKLFNYFLVFGNKEVIELDKYDAEILFAQILIEHVSELMDYGCQVKYTNEISSQSLIMIDISAIQRVLDNIFSNIMKYADKDRQVEIHAYEENERIYIFFKNHIIDDARMVESTKIGVKTCSKLVIDMQGSFEAQETSETYVTVISFPIMKEDFDQCEDEEESL